MDAENARLRQLAEPRSSVRSPPRGTAANCGWASCDVRSRFVGVYLTNEVFLYRVVDVVVTESGEMADVEDCYGLDVVRVPTRDLLARGLRVLTPA